MTRGKKPMHGISSAFFRDPVILSIWGLSGNKVGEFVDYSLIEEDVLKSLNLDLQSYGRQPTTNRPFVRVWIGNIITKLRADGILASNNSSSALTEAGREELDIILENRKNNPSVDPFRQPPSGIVTPATTNSSNRKSAEEKEAAERKTLEDAKKNAEEENDKLEMEGKAILLGDISLPINTDVPEEDCLPLPDNYCYPTRGEAAKQLKEATIAMKNRRSMYIWGLPGSGKDAFIHAFSAMTHTPSQIFTVSPNEDIQSWFFLRSFEKSGTSWEEGAFLKAARDGYKTKEGKVIPYTLLVSDLDRATKSQAESLRLVMDTIQGRLMGPGGIKYKVLPGTQIVATANSSGSGDSRGRCVSSNVLDASILDRFERKFKFNTLDWADEVLILMKKFPLFHQKMQHTWGNIGSVVKALRKGVEDESIFAEFGHRSICSWIGHSQDILEAEYSWHLKLMPVDIGNILRRGASVIYDAMPDEQTRMIVQKIFDPYIKDGVVGR